MTRRVRLSGAVLSVAALALSGCSGGNGFDTGEVKGVVEAPEGTLEPVAMNITGLLGRLHSFWVGTARAIIGIQPVGPDVEVRLERIDSDGNVTRLLVTELTNDSGMYAIATASNEQPSSDLNVSVGDAEEGTLMRAFVSQEEVNIDSAGEATVRLVLDSGFPLGNFSASGLVNIRETVDAATANVDAGATIAETNDLAEEVDAADPDVQEAIEQAGSSP